MNRKTSKFRTLRGSSAHKHGPAAMKPGLFYPNQRRLWATLALAAAALLLASCDPPGSPLTESPLPGAPSAPPPAALEVPTISGLPNMAQVKQRLNAQYAQSAQSTVGVEFDPPSISGTTVSAAITYADDQLLPMTIGSTVHRIKTITITREVDGKTIPTRVEYKDNEGTTQKTITSHYVHPPNAASNNARQSLEGGPRLAEAETEGGHTLHIRGEEKDGADNILRTFTAAERTRGGTTTLETTYRRPDKKGFTETVITENGILIQKVETYSAGATPAKGETKTKTITYEKSASAMFYPAGQKLTLAVYRDAEGEETKHDEPQDDGSMLTTMRDGSTITTTTNADNVTVAVHKEGGKETLRIETKKDGSTITTTPAADGGTLVVHKNPGGTETERVETRSDGSTITTKTTAGVTTKELVIHPSVTAIEDYAFSNNQLTELTIPPSVTAIGGAAFAGNKLTELTIPPSVTAIGPAAFAHNQLTELTIPPSVTAIGASAFSNNKLTELTIPPLVTAIGNYAFAHNQLTELTIPPLVTSIGYGAFLYNRLTLVILPNALYTASETAFNSNPAGLRFRDHVGRDLGTH